MSEISELFARDPLARSESDVDTIVTYYRTWRIDRKAFKKTDEREKVRTRKVKPVQLDLEEVSPR
jgi:hypothetical protein